MEIRVLGPLEVVGPDGEPLAIASSPQRRLVSVLAVHVDSAVRSANLEDWLGLSPGALRTSISRLRRVVGADALETTTLGYRLRAEVDAAAFERLVSLAATVDDVAARAALEEAIGLWRGDPLVEFAGEPWAEPVLARLHEQHATAVADLAVLQLDAGETSTALAAIQQLVRREPYRDRPRALLLRALEEAGRRTDALRAFQAYRSLLRAEIGTEPSAEVVDLDREIAALADTSASLGRRPDHPAWTRTRRRGTVGNAGRRHGLPLPVSSFVGRRRDLPTVSELTARHRLVTLTGAGGCGKTRLALAAATALAERGTAVVWWADLGVATDPSQVVEHVAATTGLTLQPAVDPLLQLANHLDDDRPMLLVLDNAEHLLSPVTEMITTLLPHCPTLRMLVTSREPLGIAGEVVWRVPSLSTPPTDRPIQVGEAAEYDAVQLFLERARHARPGLVVDAECLRHVTTICAEVDGLPLALELAAARTRTQPIDVVSAGIGDAVRWQAARSRAPLARHATIHASIAWSVDLVDPTARTVLARLAVFESSFSTEAALAVGAAHEPPGTVADAIRVLVDASLLQLDDATGRYRLLRTVRQFFIVDGQHGDELDRARARHAHHYATYCTEVGAGLHGIERGPLVREMPDLVAAMEWARHHEPRLVFEMCAGLASVRSALGHHANVATTWTWLMSLDRARGTTTHGPEGPDDGWTRAWAAAAAAQMAAATAHQLDVGGVHAEVDRLLPADAHRERGWLARGAAMVPAYRGRLDPIIAHVEAVTARRDDIELSIYGGFAAYMLALMGRVDESAHHVRELARMTRRHHTDFAVDTVGNGFAAAIIGDLLRGRLRSAAARASGPVPDDPAFSMTAAAALAHVALLTGDGATMQNAVDWSRRRTIPLLGYLPAFIGLVDRRLGGDVDHAADLAEQFWDEAAAVPVSRIHPLPLLTSALIDAGRPARAVAMIETAEVLVRDMDTAPLLAAGILTGRARLAVHTDHTPVSTLRELLGITTLHGFELMTLDALELVAELTDDPAVAGTLSATAGEQRHRLGCRTLPPGDELAPSGTAATTVEQAVMLALRHLTSHAVDGSPS